MGAVDVVRTIQRWWWCSVLGNGVTWGTSLLDPS